MENSGKLSGVTVSQLMSGNVLCIDADDPVSFVIKVFDRAHISGAPVVNELGEYIGVISKTDLFRKSLLEYIDENDSLDDLPVRMIMNTNPPLCVGEQCTVEKAAEKMLHHGVHRVFVKNAQEKIIGVVSSYDVLKVVASFSVAGKSDDERDQRIINLRDQLHKTKTR